MARPRAAVSMAGLGVLALLAWLAVAGWDADGPPLLPLVFVALEAAALLFPVPAAAGRTFTLAPAVQAALLLGFPAALAIPAVGLGALAASLILGARGARDARDTLLHAARALLGAGLAAVLLRTGLPAGLPPLAAFGWRAAATLGLAAVALSLAQTLPAAPPWGRAMLARWWAGYRAELLPTLTLYLVGLVAALPIRHHPRAVGLALLAVEGHLWVVPVLGVPAAFVYWSLRRTVALAEALRTTNRTLEALIAASPLAVVAHDRAGRVTLWNPAAERLLGWMRAEVLGRPPPSIPERELPAFQRQLLAALAGQSPPPTEACWRRRDGEALDVAVWMAPLRGPDGGAGGALALVTDITAQRRRAERQRFAARAGDLLASSLEYEATLEHVLALAVPDLADWCAVDLVGEDGSARRLALVSADDRRRTAPWAVAPLSVPTIPAPIVTEVVRTGQAQWRADSPVAVLAALGGDAAQRDQWRALGGQAVLCAPLLVRGRILGALTLVAAAGGRRYGPAEAELAEDLASRAALAIDHALLYREAQEATARAEAAVSARDEFLAVAAHELRAPLTPLSGYTQLARAQLAAPAALDPVRLRRNLDVVQRQADRLRRLVQQLLDVTRLGADGLQVEPVPTDLVRLAAEAVEAFRPGAGGIALTLQAPAAAWATVDPLRYEQVLANLLTNAAKYGPMGSAIEVTVEGPAAGKIHVAVRDHGPGIPAEQRARIFERSYRATPAEGVPGMGLGLYVSRQIAEAHGGTLEVVAPVDGGSCFVLTLPAVAAEAGNLVLSKESSP